MATVPVYGVESGKQLGTKEIPDEVLAAAEIVEKWLRANDLFELRGLVLADSN